MSASHHAVATRLTRVVLAFVVTLLGAPAVGLAAAAPAQAAMVYAADENGPNDFTGQKDLTRQGADLTSGVATLSLSWDDIDWSGQNTGDGCFLFDSDGDGNADYSLCTTVNGQPAQITGTVLYSCDDKNPDRCMGSTPVPMSGGTSCSVAITATDPFTAGTAHPLDTEATCTVDLSDLGGSGADELVNTCSYPSTQPNSAPSDCVRIPRDGIIKVVKVADPDEDAPFDFTLDGEAYGSTLGSGEFSGTVTPGVAHSLAETMPAGWEADPTAPATCTPYERNGAPQSPTSVRVDSGKTVICTFTNRKVDNAPAITVTKTPGASHVDEPGAWVGFTVAVENTSTELDEDLTLTALTDSVYGDLLAPAAHAGDGQSLRHSTCETGAAVPEGTTWSCTFEGYVDGNAGDTHANTVTATLVDEEDNDVTGTADAAVGVRNLDPAIDVEKDATPDALDEPGGQVTFSVSVENLSAFEPVTLETLVDDVYGDLLAWDTPGNTCFDPTPATRPVIAPAATYSCSFTDTLTGGSGDVHTNTVTATVRDDDAGSTPASDLDSAVVTFGDVDPVVTTVKAADPVELDEPGGVVTYTVSVANTSTFETVALRSLVDTLESGTAGPAFGDLLDPTNDLHDVAGDEVDGNTCNDPWELEAGTSVTITPGEAYSCRFTALVTGDAGDWHTNRVTSVVVDDGEDITSAGTARVDIRDVLPGIAVTKVADVETVAEPGGAVTYSVTVENLGNEPVTVSALVDDRFGDLLDGDNAAVTDNTCATADRTIGGRATLSCAFGAHVGGDAGDEHVNVVEATAHDNEHNPATGTGTESVGITDVAPGITVTKSADRAAVPETGAPVTYTVAITNDSAETVTLTELHDDRFGDLFDDTNTLVDDVTCTEGSTIAAGATYTCSFGAGIGGEPGAHVNVVTAEVVDDDGSPATGSDDATVRITDVRPTITVVKSANPASVPETGGVVSYTVTVQNTGFETVTLTDLDDDMFGDLLDDAGNALVTASSCSPATPIGPGGVYTCAFNATVEGLDAGDTHVNTVTAGAVDNDGSSTTGEGTATVTVTDVAPAVEVTKTADRTSSPETGAVTTFTVSVHNSGGEGLTITSLVDDVYGDLLDPEGASVSASTCTAAVVAAGETYTCSFDALVTGDAGETHRNVVTVAVVDNEGTSGGDQDDAVIGIVDVPPAIALTKTADVDSVDAPGGDVTYTVAVENVGTEDVWLTDLVDDRFGDLLDPTNTEVEAVTCAVDTMVAVGDTYACSFTAYVAGVDGLHVNVVTGTAVDNDGTAAEAQDTETVVVNEVLVVAEPPAPPAPRTVAPRPATVVLPDTGAPAGAVDVLRIGTLMVVLGAWVMLRGRRRTQ